MQDRAPEKALRKQRKAFIRKFGREPGPEDPVFFDPKSNIPQAISEAELDTALIDGMIRAGIRPELIYAYRKTGRILNRSGYENLLPGERAEWDAAIDEYLDLESNLAARYRAQRAP